MKTKRAIFIGSLIVLFICCYSIMNKHFDPLARYKYADDDNRDLIISYLSSEDINYLIDRQLLPEEFMPYFGIKDFNIRYTLYYNIAKETRKTDPQTIVDFVNKYLDVTFNHDNLEPLVRNYSYELMSDFFEYGDQYAKDEGLLIDPGNVLATMVEGKTLYRYQPEDLIDVVNVPSVNAYSENEPIKVRQETASALSSLCAAASELNGKTCGNMIFVGGFVSYDEQVALYEKALLHYGYDEVGKYVKLPGHLENQLGYTVELQLAKVEVEADTSKDLNDEDNTDEDKQSEEPKKNEQIKWLEEHIADYGFIFRYPDEVNEEKQLVLRYVGVEQAKEMTKKGLRLEDIG